MILAPQVCLKANYGDGEIACPPSPSLYPREQSKWLLAIVGCATLGVLCVSPQHFLITTTQEENDRQFPPIVFNFELVSGLRYVISNHFEIKT